MCGPDKLVELIQKHHVVLKQQHTASTKLATKDAPLCAFRKHYTRSNSAQAIRMIIVSERPSGVLQEGPDTARHKGGEAGDAAQDAALRRELHQLQEALAHRTAACVDAEGRVQAVTAEVADLNAQLKRNADLLSECQVGGAVKYCLRWQECCWVCCLNQSQKVSIS